MTDYGGDPAFGAVTAITGAGIDPDSYSVPMGLTDLEGGGLRVSARRLFGPFWFAGAAYTGFFTDESSEIGSAGANTDTVVPNLLDRNLAEQIGNTGQLDNGEADFASESIVLDQHFGDLVLGQSSSGGESLSGFWHAGLRVANTDLERDVLYLDRLASQDIATARIDFSSEMWGVGPTVGGGVALALPLGLSLSASASASALYADFDLSRLDVYTGTLGELGIRDVSLDTQEIVPVFDVSAELKKTFGNAYASLGYTMSAWLGGARSLNVTGWDNTADDTASYTSQADNIITHGISARAGLMLGGAQLDQGAPLFADGATGIIVDVAGYYLMTNFSSDPAFGAITRLTGPGLEPESGSVAMRLTDPEGGGVRVSARTNSGTPWFAGADYTGFFTDEGSSIGNVGTDTDSVLANLLDRSLADEAGLNGDFVEGEVDFASETIDVEQHFADLVLGQRFNGGGPLRGFWHAGFRIANTDVDRDVVYENLEGATDLDRAQINFQSEMWGVGPTVGGGVALALPNGVALAASASASAHYANFDLSRRDAYFNQSAGDTEIREVFLETQEIVPVFDASVEVEQRIGNFFASLGYTMSAWLGGARTLTTAGYDDVLNNTSPYTVKSDNVITHGVFARAGLYLGETPADQRPLPLGLGPNGIVVDVSGYYLMTDYGGDSAFAAIEQIPGNNINPESGAISLRLTDPEGGGVRVSARQHFGSDWFTGGAYTGFFTEEGSSIGNAGLDADGVLANLLDRTIADTVSLNGDFEDAVVDFASESVDVEQHFGDLVVGQHFNAGNGGPLQSFWQTGLRVANTNVAREVIYQNLENVTDLDTARINFGSDMWGVGPTVGGGVTLDLPSGMALGASASASALYSEFDLLRRDNYFDQGGGDTEIREVLLDTHEIVPVFDASVEVKKDFGKVFATVGYTMSAWFGGARTLSVAGFDIGDDTTSYTVKSDNIVTHGVSARVGMKFGATEQIP